MIAHTVQTIDGMEFTYTSTETPGIYYWALSNKTLQNKPPEKGTRKELLLTIHKHRIPLPQEHLNRIWRSQPI